MTNETVHEVAGQAHEQIAFMSPENTLVLLTWAVFFGLLIILNKFAWKPILAGLDQREEAIRQSVEKAEQIQREYEQLNQKRQQILDESYAQAKEIVAEARKGAQNAARVIEEKTKEETQIMIENAQREIQATVQRAREDLRKESVDLAIQLAGKLIEKNLDEKDHQKLVDDLVRKI
ncbi:MAG: F0F1 ATP synthase subunit B [Candidatus Omnitrophica bacterium]|nr:F0F1 ATP synthase subunit B [Candidatus Omnitrophota bacterium]